ncbi:MAG: hypothetical protein IT577_23920 [Verrucomicrobiae bacterium]|nr:hypothetical protein [Verrucomicrobiae bacterium]
MPVAIRERSLFSAGVEKVRFMQRMRGYLGDYMAKAIDPEHGGLRAQGRAEFVAEFRELAIREGLGKKGDIREGDLTDLRSLARLQLIFDTQVEAANEFGWWKQGQDEDVLDVFPAQRFVRVRPVSAPRDYHAAHEGEVRRKDDLQFWLSMNPDFGVPWGPWGFNSGMGVEDVDRIEAEQLGVITPEEKVLPVERELNDHMKASMEGVDKDLRARIERELGDAVSVDGDDIVLTASRRKNAN